MLESRDVAMDSLPGDIAWYTPLTPSWNIFTQRFQFTGIGKWLTTNGTRPALVLHSSFLLELSKCLAPYPAHSFSLLLAICPHRAGLRLLELLRLAPAGTCKVQTMLLTGGEGCYRGGELGIFTPMYLCVVRKPLDASRTASGAMPSEKSTDE